MTRRQETNNGFAILNHQGTLWTPKFFHTETAARNYLRGQETEYPSWDLSRHVIVPAKFVVKWTQPNT